MHHNGRIISTDEPESDKCLTSLRCSQNSNHDMEDEVQTQVFDALLATESTSNPLFVSESTTGPPKNIPRPAKVNVASPMSPRRRRAMERESMIEKVRHMVSSPFPYMVLILLVVMIVMIFVDVMPIAGTCDYNLNFVIRL